MEPRSIAPNTRAAVFAAVCTLLAVAAHRLMSAAGIPVVAEVFGAVAVFCFARIAAGLGERGLATIGLLVGGSQLGLHLLFQAVAASAVSSTAAPMDMTGMASGSGPPFPGTTPGMTTSGMTTPGMTIAHVLAAVVTAWWLRRGEAALFDAAERARVLAAASWRMVAWWIAGTRPIRSAPPAVPPMSLAIQRPPAARVLFFTVIRRGPPTVCPTAR